MIWITGDDLTVPLHVYAVCGAPVPCLLPSTRWLWHSLCLSRTKPTSDLRDLPSNSILLQYHAVVRPSFVLLASGTRCYVSAPTTTSSILISTESEELGSRSIRPEYIGDPNIDFPKIPLG